MWEASLASGRLEIEAALRALEGVREQSRVGTRTMLDVLNAEEEWFGAKVEFAQTEHTRMLAILQIRDALGQLTARAMNLPVSVYDPDEHYERVRGAWTGF